MEDKVIVGILSFLAAIIGVIIGALSTQAATQRRIQMENVVQERAKWRSRVRCLASEVHKAMMIAHFNTRRKKLHELQNRFRAVLNPNDCKDNNIIEAIDSACKCKCENRCNCENEREKKADKFGELISLLLKHDWERAKEEVKHPLLQWWKPERQSRVIFRFRWCKLFWTLIGVPVIIFYYARFIVWVFEKIYSNYWPFEAIFVWCSEAIFVWCS